MLYISDADVKSLSISSGEIVDLIKKSFHDRLVGRVMTCVKQNLSLDSRPNFFQSLPSIRESDYASVKWIGAGHAIDQSGGPQIKSLICLNDAHTAESLAILEANWITGMRTASVSLLGARLLLGEVEGVLGIIGTGVQAHAHLELFSDMGCPSRVIVWGRNCNKAFEVCNTAELFGLEASVASSHDEVLKQADIVISALGTNTTSDVGLNGTFLKKAAYLSLVDLGRPWKPDTLRHIHMYTDDCELTTELKDKGALHVPVTFVGDLVSLIGSDGPAELGAPVGLMHPGVGYADLALAGDVFERACEKEVGIQL